MHHALRRPIISCFCVTLLLAMWTSAAGAETVRVLPRGTRPDDARLGPLIDLNQYFPFVPPKTPEEWARRATRLRRQTLVATGLWPMPTKTPAHAVVHGRVDRDGFTVERVHFESYPGYFVTGSLFRPRGVSGKRPGVLCPHGHWPGGRFYDAGEKDLRWSLVRGEERFDPAGRFPILARCVQLARMGCVVFLYDMVGYADSQQLEHRPGVRPAMNTPVDWGYFSPQAELRLEHMMGLQTYNSVRTLDWFSTLPDVDPKRVGVTGASGGGTQTFVLCAIDPRPAVAFPAVMVSTAMQGGCPCENASYLRVGTGNVELAALTAPRPLGMTAANDWTKEIATKGLPQLKQLYKMLGVDDRVEATPLLQFHHNYNYVSRAVMYPWFNRYLNLGFNEPIVEGDFKPLSVADLTVWDDAHPKPPSGDAYERSLLRWITKDSEKQTAALVPRDAASLAEYRRVIGGAVDVMIGRELPPPGTIAAAVRKERALGPWRLSTFLLCNTSVQEQVPAVLLQPKKPGRRVAIWVDRRGKQALFDEHGKPIPAVERLLSASVSVLGLDLFGQGELTANGKPITKARLNHSGHGKWADYAGFTFGYNYSVFSKRVHDILAAISFLKNAGAEPNEVDLVGLAGAGHWVAAARAQAGAAVDRAVIDTAGFRFADLTAMDDPDFLPGGAKYLDLPGMIALSAGQSTWLTGEKDVPEVIRAAYRAAGAPSRLTLFNGDNPADAAVQWLLR